ncbi:phage portal protein [Algoriphagus sp. D3-2-R+10]|uniref:phage portal protein n=1 Tax=Algoriphagus aurantiacus TaxID=3103948 RepID=UPI002B3E5A2D|nr:phage portal protein [Algoriphagus sp. D3-2-R+10]MEB2775225.1 phage portal protein [Algoriphagus sp. D3-2-R+10]
MSILSNINNIFSSFKTTLGTGFYSIDAPQNEIILNASTIKSITAYTAGVNSIANSIASIPFKLRQSKDYINSDLNYLVKDKPNKFQTAYQFKRAILNDMLFRGTGFALIVRDENSGEILEIIPVDYDKVTDAKIVDNELYYIINSLPVHNDDLLVFKNSGNGAFGIDPLTVFAETLGISLSSMRYTKRNFEGDGSNIKGVITTEDRLKENQKEEFRKSIQANYTGSNSKSLLVLDKGFDFKPVSLSPDQIKLIETRNIQIAEVARILNVPIQIVASETPSNYNSIEGQQLDFYKRTLSPIIYMIEAELKHKLLTRTEIKSDYYFKGSIESLLRGDSKGRAEYYKQLFYLGAISPDEIRSLEDMPQEINGDTYVQANLIPKNIVNRFWSSKAALEYAKADEIENKIDNE